MVQEHAGLTLERSDHFSGSINIPAYNMFLYYFKPKESGSVLLEVSATPCLPALFLGNKRMMWPITSSGRNTRIAISLSPGDYMFKLENKSDKDIGVYISASYQILPITIAGFVTNV